jgi:DNA-binding transcriptional LysR family regulator
MMSMHETHLRTVDLNLLPVLEALLRLKSVTRAAAEIGLSQPATSRALARLRERLGDPLLVRTRHGMNLTPRAQVLEGQLAMAMQATKAIYAPASPHLCEVVRTVRIVAGDAQILPLGPLIAAALAKEAPQIDLVFEAYSPQIAQRIETGEIDFVFATSTTPLPPGAMSKVLLADRRVLLMRAEHPLAHRDWTMADYGSVGHAFISVYGDRQSDIDAALAAHQVTRRIAFTSPHMSAAMAVVAQTDLVTTLPYRFAKQFAHHYGVIMKETPIQGLEFDLTLVWGLLQDNDPVLRAIRELIFQAATQYERDVPLDQ